MAAADPHNPLDLVKVAATMLGDGSTRVTPADDIFAAADGTISVAATPANLTNSVLAGRYILSQHLDGGQFGRGWAAKVVGKEEAEPTVFIKTLRSNRDRHRVEGSASANASWQENMLRREVEVCMRQTDRFDPHPFITRNLVCYGDIEVPTTGKNGKMFFIMSPDLGHGGELFEYLCFQERPYVKNFDEACARRIIRQLVDAIAYLHEKGCFHRDLKLENLVLDGNLNVKVMDFGAAKYAEDCEVVREGGTEYYQTTTTIGTASYMPPELKRGGRSYNPAAFDVWSIGVILFTLLYMERLYRQGLKFDFFSRIGQGRPGYKQLLQAEPSRDGVPHNDRFWGLMENWLLDVSDPLQDLFNRIFDLSIRRRTSCKDMLAHPWMQMEPASQEAFEAEIRSRPTRVGKDRRMDLSGLGDFDAAWAAVFDACTKYSEECKNDDGNVPVSRQPGEIHVGAEPLLFVARMDYERVLTLHWVSGSLAEWLTFVFSLQQTLLGAEH